MTSTGVSVINDKVKKESGVIDAIRFETSKVIVGQSVLIDRLLIGILANGHVLVEGGAGFGQDHSGQDPGPDDTGQIPPLAIYS